MDTIIMAGKKTESITNAVTATTAPADFIMIAEAISTAGGKYKGTTNAVTVTTAPTDTMIIADQWCWKSTSIITTRAKRRSRQTMGSDSPSR